MFLKKAFQIRGKVILSFRMCELFHFHFFTLFTKYPSKSVYATQIIKYLRILENLEVYKHLRCNVSNFGSTQYHFLVTPRSFMMKICRTFFDDYPFVALRFYFLRS